MTKATTTAQGSDAALRATLDSVADAVDSPDFDQQLSQALDDNAEAIIAESEKPARTPRKRASGRTPAAAKKTPEKRTSARSQTRKAPAKPAPAQPQPKAEPKRPALAEEPVREDIARQLRVVKIEKGVVMRLLSEFTGYTSSRIGRAEQGRAWASEVDTYTRLFAAVESGELRAPERMTRSPKTAEALAKLDTLGELIRKARAEKTQGGRTRLLDEALAVVEGK